MKLLCTFSAKWRPFYFLAKFGKNAYFLPIFSNFKNSRYLSFLIRIICSIGNKAVANWGHTNACFTINSSFKMILHHFQCFHFSSIKLTSVIDLMKKYFLRRIFKVLPKLYYLTEMLWSGNPSQQYDGHLNIFQNNHIFLLSSSLRHIRFF